MVKPTTFFTLTPTKKYGKKVVYDDPFPSITPVPVPAVPAGGGESNIYNSTYEKFFVKIQHYRVFCIFLLIRKENVKIYDR